MGPNPGDRRRSAAASNSTERRRILVTASTFPRWKGDTVPPFVLFLCKELSLYFDVDVLVPHCAGARAIERLDGILVVRYRYAPASMERLAYEGGLLHALRSRPWMLTLLPSFLACQILVIRRLHRRRSYSAVNAHWIVPQGLAMLLANLRVPWLLTSHGGDLYALNSMSMRRLKRRILQAATRITVVSRAMVNDCELLGVNRSKVVVRSMGVDTRRVFVPFFPNSARESGRLLFVGRLVDKKGVAVLVAAAARLAAEGAEFALDIIGDGPERIPLENSVKAFGLSERIRFLGAVPNDELVSHYQRASIFVLPSVIAPSGDREGLGLVAVEAMACGCCVVASDLPAVRDTIDSGVNGITFEPGSSDALAVALVNLLSDEAKIRLLADRALQDAQRFDWKRVGLAYRGLLDEVMR